MKLLVWEAVLAPARDSPKQLNLTNGSAWGFELGPQRIVLHLTTLISICVVVQPRLG